MATERMIIIALAVGSILISLFGCNVVMAEIDGGYKPVAAKPGGVQPILVGQQFPKVVLKAADGATVDFTTVLADKPSILIFYRGGW